MKQLSRSGVRSSRRQIKEYLKLDYPFEVAMEDGDYYVSFPDLPGCMADGSTIEKALKNAEKAKRLWMETALAHGKDIPEPAGNYSGRLVVRMPKSLHRDLTMRARREGVSLNQYIMSKLAKT